MSTFTKEGNAEKKDCRCYTYWSYELRRQAKISHIFRKIRLFYLVFCIVFLAAAHTYVRYSLLAAAILTAAAIFYSLLRLYWISRQEWKWRAVFWLDLVDYILIGLLVYITGGSRSFFHVAYAIPILAATMRLNIRGGLWGIGLAALFTVLNAFFGNYSPAISYPTNLHLFFSLGTLLFAVWALSGLIGDEVQLRKELYNFSVSDPLTGLYHRGYARERINEEIARCRQEGTSFSLIFIDLDNFKEVNDRYGHLVGDAVIRHVAAVLQSAVRKGDILSRYGGDEFLLLLPGAAGEEAELMLQRLLRVVKANPYYLNGVPVHLGLSGGIAEYPSDGQNPEQLLQVADQKMYCQKR